MQRSFDTIASAPLPALQVYKLLIVEDELTVAYALQQMVEKWGYVVTGIAKSAAEATDLLDKETPDMVLTDIYLYGNKTGIELAHHLRSQHIPFIYISAFADKNTLEEAKATGPYGYLVKPFREKDVYATLELARYRHAHAEEVRLRKEKEALLAALVAREREKALLLGLSEEIARIRSSQELFSVLYEKIQPLFGSDFSAITVINVEKNQVLHPLVAGNGDWQKTLPAEYIVDPRTPEPYHGHFIEYVYTLPEGTSYSIPRFEGVYSGAAIAFCKQVGLVESFLIKLNHGGKLIGDLSLHAKEPGRFASINLELLKSIANQVAVAVANILANEEIREREREKSFLLSISEKLAAIRNLNEIVEMVWREFKPAFGFEQAVLSLYDAGGEFVRHLHFPVRDFATGNGNYQQLVSQPIPLENNPHEVFRTYREPVIVTPDDFAVRYPQHVGIKAMRELGLEESVIMPLRTGDNLLGMLEFHAARKNTFGGERISLYKNLADQVAVAVANILANEEMLQQKAAIEEREREKGLQVALINAITQDNPWPDKLLRVARLLQETVPFDYLSFGLGGKHPFSRGYGFVRVGRDEYQALDLEGFLRVTKLTLPRYLFLFEQEPLHEARWWNGEDFARLGKQHPLKSLLATTFGLASQLHLPLGAPPERAFSIDFYSKKPGAYTDQHLELLTRLTASLTLTIEKLLAYQEITALKEQLQHEKQSLEEEIAVNYNFGEIVGSSQAIKEVFQKVGQVASTESTVLILGETGTGKELVARALHTLSPRKERALIKLNCAALPAQLIESELFGHERGAFTGAVDRRIGKFELASGSTIFLDEIGELPLELQAKLLRVLQEKEFERLGGNKVIKSDVRIIAATNRNLEQEVAQGRFRADLYFRLNVFPITLPPLRERKEDIPLLAVHFTGKLAKKFGKPITGIANTAIKEMQAYNWPGNIRELEHMLERAAITATNGTIKELALPQLQQQATVVPFQGFALKTMADNERELIIRTLQYCNGRIRGKGGAAEILGIEANTLDWRMKKLGIVKQHVVAKA